VAGSRHAWWLIVAGRTGGNRQNQSEWRPTTGSRIKRRSINSKAKQGFVLVNEKLEMSQKIHSQQTINI
jgi:hypothetical protein